MIASPGLSIALACALSLAASARGAEVTPATGPATGPAAPQVPLIRFGTPMPRHAGPIYAVAVSPDGRLAASASGDATVRVWDTRTGRCLRRFDTTANPVTVAFGAAGKTVAFFTVDDVKVTVAAVEGNQEPRSFTLDKLTQRVEFSPDASLLAASAFFGGVKVWDVAKGKEIVKVQSFADLAMHMAFSADNRLLVFAGVETRNRGGFLVAAADVLGASDLAKGQQRWTIRDPNWAAWCFALSPDGNTLAAVPADTMINPASKKINLLDARKGKVLASFPIEGVQHLEYTADGRQIAGLTENAFFLWDANTMRQVTRIDLPASQGGFGLGLSRDGSIMSCIGSDEMVHLWNTRTGKPLLATAGHTAPAKGLLFESGGKALLSAALDGTVRRWPLAEGNQARPLQDLGKTHQFLAISADGRTAASYCETPQGAIAIRNIDTGSLISSWPMEGRPESTALSADGELLATATPEGVCVWHCLTGRLLFRMEEAASTGQATTREQTWQLLGLAFSPDGKLLARCDESGVRVLELATGKATALVTPDPFAQSVAFSPDGRSVAVGWMGATVFDLLTQSRGHSLPANQEGVTAVAFSPDARRLATAGADTTIFVWALPEGRAAPASRPISRPASQPVADERTLPGLWEDLGSPDASKAWKAAVAMVLAPWVSAAFLKDRLKPAAPAAKGPSDIASLLADLDSDNLRTREQASAMLASGVQPARLREALAKAKSEEVRTRLGEILAKLASPAASDPADLRAGRAVRVLELIGDEAARSLLEALASGGPDRLSRDAAGALLRIRRARGENVGP